MDGFAWRVGMDLIADSDEIVPAVSFQLLRGMLEGCGNTMLLELFQSWVRVINALSCPAMW